METIPNTIVYVDLPPYLVQWYKHAMDCPKTIRLPKQSVESRVILFHLRKRKKDEMDPEPETDSYLEIEIPKFRDIDWKRYCMLTDEGFESLRSVIRARFRDAMFRDLMPLINSITLRTALMQNEKQELIMQWMKISGIEDTETNFRSVLKVFDRLRANFRDRRLYAKSKEEEEKTSKRINTRFEKLREVEKKAKTSISKKK